MAAEAETARKRFREEEAESGSETKRQCSLNSILSLLESEEEESTEDLSSIITTLQQELSSSSSSPSSSSDPGGAESGTEPPTATAEEVKAKGGEEEVVMKHLLEASDDELGIPSPGKGQGEEAVGELRGVVEIQGYDGFWEFEDEAANYYTLLQSELFLS